MAESESPSNRVERIVNTIAPLGPTIRRDPMATIVPPPDDPDTGAGRAISTLAGQTATIGSLADRVRPESSLGHGGMGEVLLAEQLSVGRKVAVKRLLPGRGDDGAVSALLREGWVTGALEHPNVAPLYDLGLDDDGLPLLMLKRISGVQWRALMFDAAEVRRRFGTGLLEYNVQILMQLCNAVSFAHSKGILHRDIKPENVMIGEFGEVYLLDWGIAVALEEDRFGRLPNVKNLRQLAGTPGYMAPEMLDWASSRLTAQTDVYLLGAVLYEILSGSPPHAAQSLEQLIRSVLASKPEIPQDAPAELADICRRALSVSSEDRHGSPEELRLALQAYLDHRGSAKLAEEAQRSLSKLEAQAETPSEDPNARVELYEAFSECRFGFRQALATWPDNAAAHAGLVRATEIMIDLELAAGDPGAAAALVAQLGSSAPASLQERVQAAVESSKRRAAEVAELEEFRVERDTRTGKNTRRFIVAVMGVLWMGLPFMAYAWPDYADRHEPLIFVPIGSVLLLGALAWWARESVSRSLVNRSIILGVLACLVVEIAVSVAGLALGLPAPVTTLFHFSLWAAVSACVVISFLPRLWWVPLIYLSGFVVSAWRPELRFFAMAISHLGMALGVAAWAPLNPADQRS